MFQWDSWMELFERLNRNRFRTALTMLSVSWGIIMLVLLLAGGTGLENNIRKSFNDDATNSIWFYPGRTSKPFRGFPVGRRVKFNNDDFYRFRDFPGVERITRRYRLYFPPSISYRNRHASFDIRCTDPDHVYLENTIMLEGRFLNQRDIIEKRKVAVVGDEVVSFLFPGKDPIGEMINVGNIAYQVVGVFTDEGRRTESKMIYIPVTTAQSLYGAGDEVNVIMFTMRQNVSLAESLEMEERVRADLALTHHFSPNDRRAIRARNYTENMQEVLAVFKSIRWFTWFVGIGTLMAGIVGVSNIMLVSVKERTSEIGLRKALGGTPSSIVMMIMKEALFLTASAGYFGLLVSMSLVYLVNSFIPPNDYFQDAQVNEGAVIFATGLIVVAGVLAGIFPALQAARVNPIVALRDDHV